MRRGTARMLAATAAVVTLALAQLASATEDADAEIAKGRLATWEDCGFGALEGAWYGQKFNEEGELEESPVFVLQLDEALAAEGRFVLEAKLGRLLQCVPTREGDATRGVFTANFDTLLAVKFAKCSWRQSPTDVDVVNMACLYGASMDDLMRPVGSLQQGESPIKYAWALKREPEWLSAMRHNVTTLPILEKETLYAVQLVMEEAGLMKPNMSEAIKQVTGSPTVTDGQLCTDDDLEAANADNVELEHGQVCVDPRPREHADNVLAEVDDMLETAKDKKALEEAQRDEDLTWGQDQVKLREELGQETSSAVEDQGKCLDPVVRVYSNGGAVPWLARVDVCDDDSDMSTVYEALELAGHLLAPALYKGTGPGQVFDAYSGEALTALSELLPNRTVMLLPARAAFVWVPVRPGFVRHVSVGAAARTVALETVSVSPRVFRMSGLLPEDVTAEVLSAVKREGVMTTSGVVSKAAGAVNHRSMVRERTSRTGWLSLYHDDEIVHDASDVVPMVPSLSELVPDLHRLLRLGEHPATREDMQFALAQSTWRRQERADGVYRRLQEVKQASDEAIRKRLIEAHGEATGNIVYFRTREVRGRVVTFNSTLETEVPMDNEELDQFYVEAPQVVHYTHGQHYYAHTDADDDHTLPIATRLATLLFYLNDLPEGAGGGTNFPHMPSADDDSEGPAQGDSVGGPRVADQEMAHACKLGQTMEPTAGDAILFYNIDPGTMQSDPRSLHIGCDVLDPEAEKWATNLWFHVPTAFMPIPDIPDDMP